MEQPMEQITLSDEQRKRLELVEAYEAETSDARAARNKALEEHKALFSKRWAEVQEELEVKRAQAYERMRTEGRTPEQIQAVLVQMVAADVERHLVEKDAAVRQLELVKVKSWLEWLEERKQKNPDDPTLDSLIEEAKKSPDPAIDGYLKQPPPSKVLSDLVPSFTDDGAVAYQRGMFTAIIDRGTKLDVKRVDDRDIEAALKIAAQKFDTEKGLLLTGDLAFKRRAAEIAARMNLMIRNTEPEVLAAYKKAKEAAMQREPGLAAVPTVSNSIGGEVAERIIAEIDKPVQIMADKPVLENAAKVPGITVVNDYIEIPGDRYLAATRNIRELPITLLPIVQQIDVTAENGGLSAEQIARLDAENQGLVENGKLTQAAYDMALVRDDRVLRNRGSTSPELLALDAYSTNAEIRLRQGRNLEQAVEQEVPTVEQQPVEEKKLEPELPPLPKRRERDLGLSM